MSIVKEEHKATLRKWHEELQEKRGERASLRRSTTVNDVCLTDGFRLFLKNRQIKWQDEPEWRITALALIAAVSANVKAIDERQPFAAQLAAVMSKGRFTRLSAVKTPDELLRQLRRAVRLLNGSVNLDSLAEGGLPLVPGERRPAQSSPPPAAANRIYPYPLGAGILPGWRRR